MQGLFRRAVASVAALVLLAPTAGEASFASSPHRALSKITVALASPPQRIPVKEPARVKPSPPPAEAFHPKGVQGVRAHGIPVAGPPMLRPVEVDHAIAAMRRRALQQRSMEPNTPLSAPPSRSLPLPAPAGTRPGIRRAMSLPSDPTASGTGINHWWRYQEQSVPGDGHLMVNVGTGNLLLQDDDMAIPHKGIAMAFRRTYNSQSPTTVSGDLQTWTNLYGGWTNTFDAHVIRTSPNHFSVYDVDGARYDYLTSGGYTVSAPPGDHSTLTWDGNCGLLWQKKSGTLYYFYGVVPTQACSMSPSGTVGGYAGRIHQIIGRNRNTYITFNYSWDNGDASASGKISGITATTESGMTATLSFADFNGHRLLQQLTYPDGATYVSYAYDGNGNLVNVIRPPNNSSGTRPVQGYGYQAFGSGYVLLFTASPRWNWTCATVGCNVDGAVLVFYYSGSSVPTATLNTIEHRTLANPDEVLRAPFRTRAGVASIALEHVTKRYPTGTVALDDVSLEIADGEFVAVVGPSGCGKSTLLRILAGLDRATGGRVEIAAGARAGELPSGTVFQEASLFPWMRVRENVAVAFDSLDVPRETVQRRVREVLGLVGLADCERAWPHELSGGMKQRAAVARAFVTDPPVLFMDEPFGALDEQTRVGLANELMRLWERSPKTIVFVTHGIEEAVTLADRIVVLSSRPGQVKAIIPIDFPRPRDAVAIRGEPRFGEHVVRIWELLR